MGGRGGMGICSFLQKMRRKEKRKKRKEEKKCGGVDNEKVREKKGGERPFLF